MVPSGVGLPVIIIEDFPQRDDLRRLEDAGPLGQGDERGRVLGQDRAYHGVNLPAGLRSLGIPTGGLSPALGILFLLCDDTMSQVGWKRLLAGSPWFRGEDAYPIPAYSEFMSPPRLARSPYGATVVSPLADDDLWGWRVSEREEVHELLPGMEQVARQIVPALAKLCRGESSHGIADQSCEATSTGPTSSPIARARWATSGSSSSCRWHFANPERPGAIRWTLFGGSEQGPARVLARLLHGPDREAPTEEAIGFLRSLLARAYGEPAEGRKDLAGPRLPHPAAGRVARPFALLARRAAAELDRPFPLVRGRARSAASAIS